MSASANDPHLGRPVLTAGSKLVDAGAAMILLHGRGAGAADIIGLADIFDRPDIAYLAPDARGHVWYHNPFMTPAAGNEPYLSSALGVVARLIAQAGKAGVPPEKIALLGFSQGACLALDFAARNPRRYGAVLALSGGLIGARIMPASYSGSLAGTPVLLGCSNVDPFIPLERVQESAAIMRHLGGDVTERIYPGAGHSIVQDEVGEMRRIVEAMTAPT